MNPYRVIEAQNLLANWTAQPQLALRFPLYGAYLQTLANADRLDAVNKYLRPLIIELGTLSQTQRFEFISALCYAVDFTGRVPGSSPVPGMPYELLEQIALPTLLAQRTEKPDDAYAHVWLAMLPSRRLIPDLPEARALLEAAHKLAPADSYITARLIEERINSISFSCHHLPRTLLSSEEDVRKEIAYVRSLLTHLRLELRDALAKQVDTYEQQINGFVRMKRGECEA